MTNIGFLGLGSMGSAMAKRLIDAGHQVTVWNRSAGKADDLVDAGATLATTAAEAIANPVVISILANDQAAEAVFTAENLAAAPADAVHVNMASVSVAASERLTEAHKTASVGYIACPVLGRPEVAAAGNLTLVAGGPTDLVERLASVFEILGRRTWHVGESQPTASLVKIGVNFNIIHALQALSESVTLVQQGGVDGSQFIDIINDSLFPGPVYGGYGKMIAARNYMPPAFNVTLGRKDLRLAQEAAQGLSVNLPTADALVDVFEEALADEKLAPQDWASIAEITRRRSGIEPKEA